MPPDKTTSIEITRFAGETFEQADDLVAIEEPLEIRAAWQVDGEPREKTISVTMRTPGDDFDLAAGFLFTEGLLRDGGDIESVRHWGSPNQVRVALAPHARIDASKLDRHFYTTSSCGVCGKTSIDALYVAARPPAAQPPIASSVVRRLPRALQEAQTAFNATGGVHGAALFDAGGTLLRLREDVGRHNAVDKVIGSYLRERENPFAGSILVVSSRGSFEIVQKAVVAGIGTVAFIGGPSSLAVELARRFHITLLGFVRDGRFNVYSGRVA
ncbi:MAG TPA: formate dehydrogenase accessory sulfurtransferase FdhD [Thermoanaerobaculia bacterium]